MEGYQDQETVINFLIAYADQTKSDRKLLKKAMRDGRLKAWIDGE